MAVPLPDNRAGDRDVSMDLSEEEVRTPSDEEPPGDDSPGPAGHGLDHGARELDDDRDIFTDTESQLSWDGDSEDGNFSVSGEESDDQHLPTDDEDDADGQNAKPGTAAYYKERLNQQIYENAKLTVIQAVCEPD